jgi:hypothetical protein
MAWQKSFPHGLDRITIAVHDMVAHTTSLAGPAGTVADPTFTDVDFMTLQVDGNSVSAHPEPNKLTEALTITCWLK